MKEDTFTDSFLELRGIPGHARPQWAAAGAVRWQKESGDSRGKAFSAVFLRGWRWGKLAAAQA